MFDTINASLRQWHENNNDRAKLQHAYFTAIILFVVLAGLVSLLNVELGRQILAAATITGGVFLVNAVAWALLRTFVTDRLSVPAPTPKKPATSTRTATKK